MDLLEREHHERKKIMSALTNLTESISALSTSVDNAVAALAAQPSNDPAIQAAADQVTALTAQLDAAVNPPVVTPPQPPVVPQQSPRTPAPAPRSVLGQGHPRPMSNRR